MILSLHVLTEFVSSLGDNITNIMRGLEENRTQLYIVP